MVAVAVLEAAGDGDLAALKRFRDQSVSENIIDNLGCNCLHYAARKGGADVLGYLVNEKGFHGNRRSNIGATAAHDAAAAGNLEALQWLLKHGGCNINDQDGAGATVLHLACRFGHTRVTEWLLDIAKADSSMRTASNGLPLHFAVVGGDYDAVKLLVDDDPSSVNYQLSNGATATYLAAQEGHIEILRLLIQESRGNVKLKAYDGMSCVHAAAQSGHLNCVRFLVEEEKCNPNDRDFDGATPLHFAASQGHTLIIDWLMRVGGARVMLDNLGGSPLHNAAECDQQESAKVLISHGCSIEITDNNGLTAAELARKCHNESCAHLIETFQPQSQLLLDEDVAYLQSVQSPRQPPGGHTQQPVARQQQTSSFGGPVHLTNNTRNQVHLLNGNHGSSNGYLERNTQGLGHSPVRSRSPFSGKERPRSPVEIVLPLTDKHQERPGTPGSVSARADSDEFPVGVPRNFSQDWSTNENFSGSPVGSSSSLSSLSHLDDAIAVATQEVEKIKSTQTAPGNRKLDSHPVLSGQQEKKIFQIKSYNSNVKNNAGKDAFLATGQKMTKNVKFQHQNEDVYGDAISTRYVTRIEAHGKEPLKKDLHATSNLAKPVMMQSQEMDHKGSNLNENGLNNGPASLFTAEMMMAQRNTLTPAQTRTAIENSADTDFIQELKMATKGPGLRKTSKNGDSGAKPVMTFSAGHKTVPKDSQTNDKEVKVELTGEWDPKNFVDQVPNKADLPAWKVQLQAKHIAEKAMKEAQEKRKVEENESRFKNMPAWKRALVEKKEAEAKAEEEKRALELEQQHKLKAVHKRIPAVAVTAKPGPEGKLSPWQQELQHR